MDAHQSCAGEADDCDGVGVRGVKLAATDVDEIYSAATLRCMLNTSKSSSIRFQIFGYSIAARMIEIVTLDGSDRRGDWCPQLTDIMA